MYLNHKNLDKYWVIDIETDDVDATVIWCIVLKNVGTNETVIFRPNDVVHFSDWVRRHPDVYYVGHNAISFDVPTVNRLTGAGIPLSDTIDTLVLSYLYNPRMSEGHSLEAWGVRLKFNKGDFHDFSQFTEEMLTYCIRDVELTTLLFVRISERMRDRGFSERSCRLEHEIRIVVDDQQANGFYFDIDAARKLHAELVGRAEQLGLSIHKLFPPTLEHAGTYKYRIREDGSPFASYQRHLERYESVRLRLKDGEYDVYEYKPFNIGSPAQRVTKLLSLGWKPQKFTEKGNPQVDEESLLDFYNKSDRPEIKAIAEWLVFTGRANMVQTWLNNVGPDSRIHGKVFTCKAGTRRMTHSAPNTANIPKASAKVPYGKECRQLWSVADKDRRRLVGYDAKGLEMRMFAHYLNNPVAAELYVSGDPHQVNADLLGIERDPVKNVFYAFLYGAADPKLGWTGNTSLVSKKEQREFGKFIRGELVAKTPGLTELVKLVQAEGTWIQCIDGGYVRCEAEHARINYKLQSAGAIVMKQASIFADRYIKQRGLDALLVGSIHDEGQLDTALKDTEEVGKLCVQAIIDAGEELNFRVPLDGDYKIGFSWAETH